MQRFTKYLNPLYKDIKEIADFSTVIYNSDLEKDEYPHLEKVTKITEKQLIFLLEKLEKLEKDLEEQILLIDAENDPDEKKAARSIYNAILLKIEEQISRINSELIKFDSPYFGKISFQPQESPSKELTLYIGKFALVDQDTHQPLIVDWRSPISNIYYENSGPKEGVSFQAPVGERIGDLKQKRQFQISRARISGIYDAKSGNVAADEFLLAQLNERIGKKLQDIVSTIQTQQNEIIRGEINKPILIQGVAGSGKTTILLHRLAYIFYTYREKIKPENSLIIAPNQMFIDYVSDVLPNLGVQRVETSTYLFWAKKILGWDQYYKISNEKEDLAITELKGSLKFLEMLDKYIEIFEENLLENIPYSGKEIIARRYFELKELFKDLDMLERLDLATEYAFAQSKFDLEKYKPWERGYMEESEKRSEIDKYLKKSLNIFSLYKNMFRGDLVEKYISKYTLKGLQIEGRIHNYRMEDLAAMLYLHFKINGVKEYKKDSVMIDEVQDMSYIQIATLAMIARNGNLTLAGDLAQSIIPPFHIKEWQSVCHTVEKYSATRVNFFQLNKCYRTTIEIVEFANKIFKKHFPKNFDTPEAVLRHGEDVNILEFKNSSEDFTEKEVEEMIKIINEQFVKGAVTCAILCKNQKHANTFYSILEKHKDSISREIINYTGNDYKSGLLILPISSAKGLEFDSIILPDFNSQMYTTNIEDIKLIYVGITRALHRVFIITKENDNILETYYN